MVPGHGPYPTRKLVQQRKSLSSAVGRFETTTPVLGRKDTAALKTVFVNVRSETCGGLVL